jgi:hypothetical protein
MLVSSLYFRTHTNVGLQEEVPEERNDDDGDDNDDDYIASESHTPSPSLSTSSTVSKRKTKFDVRHLRCVITKLTSNWEEEVLLAAAASVGECQITHASGSSKQ